MCNPLGWTQDYRFYNLVTVKHESFNPLQDDKILDWSILKQSADNNFKFDENSRKFSKWVELFTTQSRL